MFLSRRILKIVAMLLVWQMLVSPACLLAANIAEVAASVYLTVDKSEQEKKLVDSNKENNIHLTDKEKAYEFGNSLLDCYLQEGKNHGPAWLKTTELGLRFTENGKPVYSLETLQPLNKKTDSGPYCFWQGRYAHGGDNSTSNVGLVRRKLSSDKSSMIGFNTFYDYNFKYNLARLGLGAEYFNKLAEYRLNYYYPLSGDKQTGVYYLTNGILYSYIRAVEGLDFKADTSFTHMPWLRLSLGGYYWDNKHHDDELGYKLESEMQLTPRINLNLGYSHSNTSHSFYGEIKYQLKDDFGLSLLGGKNKEKSASQSVGDKLWQKVERDNNIKTETFTKFVSYTGNIRTTVINSHIQNSTPIAGATVQAYQNGAAVGGAVTTDAAGIAIISGLATGNYTVSVTYGGITGISNPVTVEKDSTAETSVSLDVDGGNVTVMVVNSQHEAISGAIVTINMSSGAYARSSLLRISATTDASGAATFTNLPPGTYMFTVKYNSRTMTSEAVTVMSGSTITETIMAPANGGTIRIVIKDNSNTAVSGAAVTVLAGTSTVATGIADENGIALIGGLAAGSYTLSVSSKNPPTLDATATIEVSEGKTSLTTVMLTKLTGSAAVTVTFSDGATNVTPTFTLDGNTTITGTAGTPQVSGATSLITYTFTGISVGSHTIAAADGNYTSSTVATVTATTGTPTPGSITLTRKTGSAAVTVTFSDGATNVTPTFTLDGNTTITGTAGTPQVSGATSLITYTFTGISVGSHTIAAADGNYTSSPATTVTVTTGTPTPGSITLTRKTGSAAVTVTFSDGATDVTPAFTLDGSATITGTAGTPQVSGATSLITYTFTDISVGSHTIAAAAGNYTSNPASVTVTATTGTPTPGSITLTRQTGNVLIFVNPGESISGGGSTVSFTVNGQVRSGTCNTYGSIQFNDIPTDTYTFTAVKGGYSGTTNITVENGQTSTGSIYFTYQYGDARITVLNKDTNQPVSGAKVTLNSQQVESGADGVATFTHYIAGSYTASALCDGYKSSDSISVTIPANGTGTGTIELVPLYSVTLHFSSSPTGLTYVTGYFRSSGSSKSINSIATDRTITVESGDYYFYARWQDTSGNYRETRTAAITINTSGTYTIDPYGTPYDW